MRNSIRLTIIGLFILSIAFVSCNRRSSVTAEQATKPQLKKSIKEGEVEESLDPMTKQNDQVEIGESIQTVPLRSPFQEEADTVFLLKRTACYGNCPQYTAILLSDGTVYYQGKRNVDKIGRYTSKVNKRKIFELDGMIQKYGFYDFKEEYPVDDGEKILDASNTIVFSEYQSKRKEIFINHDAPAKLVELIDYMDSFFQRLEWEAVGMDD